MQAQTRRDDAGSDGRYRIVGLLGAGGMGTVVDAIDTRDGRRVALKFARIRTDEPAGEVQQLLVEANAMTRARSPHVCEVFGVTTCEGRPCLAMERLSGRTLRCRRAREPLAIEAVVGLGLQLTYALERVHGAGLVHQDIKPANIFVTSTGLIKLLDFGTAIWLGDGTAGLGERPADSSVLGTSNYIAPERILRRPPDPRSDLFSLGAVLYEMVTGRQPFAGTSPADVLFNVLDAHPLPLRAHVPDCPVGLDHTVRKLLARRLDRRFQSAFDLRRALWRLRDQASARRVVVTGVPGRQSMQSRERRPIPPNGPGFDHDAALALGHVAGCV